MEAQTTPQIDRERPHLFQPGVSPNPGGKLKGRRYHEVYDGLAAELGGKDKLSESQKVILDRIAEGKCTSATISRLMRQLGLPAGKDARVPPTTMPLNDMLARRGAK